MGVMILQHRILNMRDFKVRENENGNPVIEGYFAKFNEFYEVCKGWKEKISPGAFRNYLQSGGEIKVLWNHNSDIVMGSRSNGTALFREDERNLLQYGLPQYQSYVPTRTYADTPTNHAWKIQRESKMSDGLYIPHPRAPPGPGYYLCAGQSQNRKAEFTGRSGGLCAQPG